MISKTSLRSSLGALLGVALAVACGSEELPRLNGYGFACASSDECAASLTCRYQRCRQGCEEDADCDLGVCLRGAGYSKGVCALSGDQGCADKVCPAGLRCADDGWCRHECQTGADCSSSDACEANACGPS